MLLREGPLTPVVLNPARPNPEEPSLIALDDMLMAEMGWLRWSCLVVENPEL